MVTMAGTGVQGLDLEGGHPGREQPINSPWDVTLGKSAGKVAHVVQSNNLECLCNNAILFLFHGNVYYFS